MPSTTFPSELINFDALPDSALVDIKVLSAISGRSVASTWRDLRAGRIPQPLRIGLNSTRWRVGDIRAHLASLPTSTPSV
jgi:predicted DNA-binding transcriptional regulator AlpA